MEDILSIVEKDRSLDQWLALGKNSLILTIGTLHLVQTGSKDELAQRIYNYHLQRNQGVEAGQSGQLQSLTSPTTQPTLGPINTQLNSGTSAIAVGSTPSLDKEFLCNLVREELRDLAPSLMAFSTQSQDPTHLAPTPPQDLMASPQQVPHWNLYHCNTNSRPFICSNRSQAQHSRPQFFLHHHLPMFQTDGLRQYQLIPPVNHWSCLLPPHISSPACPYKVRPCHWHHRHQPSRTCTSASAVTDEWHRYVTKYFPTHK